MKFGSHIGKGAWAIASRGLPLLYYAAFIAVQVVIPKPELGMLADFMAIFIMLTTFSDNFAFQAIVKFGVEPDVDLQELVSATAALFLGFIVLVLSLLFLLGEPIGRVLKFPGLPSLLPSLTVLVLVTGPRVATSKVLQMRFRMRELFFVDLANLGLGSVLLAVLLSQHRINRAEDVIDVTIVTGAVSALLGFWLIRNEMKFSLKFSRKTYDHIANFIRYQSGMGLVSVFQAQSDTLLVSAFTGPIGVATYSIAKSFYRGFDMIRDTTVMFIFPASSKFHSRGEIATLKRVMEKAVGFLYLGLLPIGAILAAGAPFLFHLIYHSKYDASIPIFQVLCLAALVLPLQMVCGTAISGIGKVRESFHITLIAYILNIILAFIFLNLLGIIGAAIAFLAGTACQALLSYRFMKREIGFESKGLLRQSWLDAFNFVKERTRRQAT